MSIIRISYTGYEEFHSDIYHFNEDIDQDGFIFLCKKWLKSSCPDSILVQENIDLISNETLQYVCSTGLISFYPVKENILSLTKFFNAYRSTIKNNVTPAFFNPTFLNEIFLNKKYSLLDDLLESDDYINFISPTINISFNEWIKKNKIGFKIEHEIDKTFNVFID